MSDQFAIQPADLDPGGVRLAALEAQLAEREHELAAVKHTLRQLQARYFQDVGPLYAKLHDLDAAVAEHEIRLGLRPPPLEDDGESEAEAAEPDADARHGCSNRAAPTQDLKKIFRDLAKAIHPDRALDERTRYRRHSLMAEANRAYAERDEDRLRLILNAWERNPDAILDDASHAGARSPHRPAAVDARLMAIDAELADLRSSAIGRLSKRIDDAKTQGWDLFAEIVQEVKREISRATARLASLRRKG